MNARFWPIARFRRPGLYDGKRCKAVTDARMRKVSFGPQADGGSMLKAVNLRHAPYSRG